MQPLRLRPLPSSVPAGESASATRVEGGFVDEAVVRHLIAGPVAPSLYGIDRPDFTRATNAQDFAGWCLPMPAATVIVARRPGPPELGAALPVDSYRKPLRKWQAAIAGAACGLVFATLPLHIPARLYGQNAASINTHPTHAVPAGRQAREAVPQVAPELTRLLDDALPATVAGD